MLKDLVIPLIIPYYKAPEQLKLAKACLGNQTGLQVEIFVHDNSIDNLYFTKAINLGIKNFINKNHTYLMILNQDAYLRENCILEMLEVMNEHPTCGICTPVSFNAAGKCNWFGGLDAYPMGRHKTTMGDMKSESSFESLWANGACMLLRVAMVQEIGMFDENMRFLFSDSDYSFTARSRGWQVRVATKAFMDHSLSGSAAQSNPELDVIKLEDQLYFAQKWLSGDIYKKLSHEGDKLTPKFVKTAMSETEENLDYFRDLLKK
jgi:GT2 family glycosyltransferase